MDFMRGPTNATLGEPKLPKIVWTGTLTPTTNLSISTYFGYDDWSDLDGHAFLLISHSSSGTSGMSSFVAFYGDDGCTISSMTTAPNDVIKNQTPYLVDYLFTKNTSDTTLFNFYTKRAYVSSQGDTNWKAVTEYPIKKIIQIC